MAPSPTDLDGAVLGALRDVLGASDPVPPSAAPVQGVPQVARDLTAEPAHAGVSSVTPAVIPGQRIPPVPEGSFTSVPEGAVPLPTVDGLAAVDAARLLGIVKPAQPAAAATPAELPPWLAAPAPAPQLPDVPRSFDAAGLALELPGAPMGYEQFRTASPLIDLATALGSGLTDASPLSTPQPGLDRTGLVREPGLDGVRADFPILEQKVNGHRLVWLDNAATTQKPRVVIAAVSSFYERDNSNVHRGAHTLAGRATEAYEAAREKVRRYLGADAPEEIVFVRGATEAINLVAQAWGRSNVKAGDEILVTHLEHHSNIVPWQLLANERGALLRPIPVDDRGDVDLEAYERMLSPRVKLVALTQISNALGTVVPVGPMAVLARERGARVLVDGAQSVAHLPLDVRSLGADFFVFSGHKVYGPTGIGVLWGRRELLDSMPPWQGGGSMIRDVTFERTILAPPPAKFEAGTPHLAGAVGLGVALDYVESLGRPQIAAFEHSLLQQMVAGLRTVPGLKLVGEPMLRASSVSFVIKGREPADIAKHLDRNGIAVRAGHHCAQPILRRFGHEATVRPSVALYNVPGDVECLIEALRSLG
jgi:cysteine desulfurase / selenocysteine lyase